MSANPESTKAPPHEGRRAGTVPAGTVALAAVLLIAAVALGVVAMRGSAAPTTLQDRIHQVAASLRCPVCQNLSVADSPSRLAEEMRTQIGLELQAGKTPDQIRHEFVASYGEWVLLAPPKQGLDLIAWLVPLLLLLGGLGVAGLAIRRWTAGRQIRDAHAKRAADAATGPGEAVPADQLTAEDRRLLERALAEVLGGSEEDEPE
jgi:cytochrome c-type biogenesis protein CcmH